MFQGKTLSLVQIENGFVELNFDNQSGSVNKFNHCKLSLNCERRLIFLRLLQI